MSLQKTKGGQATILQGKGANTSFCIYMFGNRFEKKVLEMEEKGRSVRFMLLFFSCIFVYSNRMLSNKIFFFNFL